MKETIEGIKLDERHVGAEVVYVPRHAHGDRNHKDCEHGVISSWNDGGVFVKYPNLTARTDYDTLVWLDKKKWCPHIRFTPTNSKWRLENEKSCDECGFII